HQPRYNTKLRDDKNFLHLRIDPRSNTPRFTLVRRIKDDGARYFGPYASATNARRTLAFVSRSFPLRTCTDQVLRTRKKPCLLYQMKRCLGPCVDLCTPTEYSDAVQDAMLFLSGKNRELVARLQTRMMALADAERFEEATHLRDLMAAVKSSLDHQSVVDVRLGDRDVWSFYREGQRGAVTVLPVRAGHMQQPLVFPFEGELAEDGELLSAMLNTWYDAGEHVPPEILLPIDPPDHQALQDVLSDRRVTAGLKGKVTLLVPKRGEKVRVLEIAEQAAKARFATTHSAEDRISHALEALAEIAGLEVPPYRIECYDNSNLLGQDPVASQVVFIEGVPARAEYRRYKIKTVVGADDYASMREILTRRLRRASEEGSFPDLIVVDGGRGQLSAAEDVLRELGLEDQPVIGLSKPRTERKRGELDAVDKIILRGNPEPVILAENHPTLRMLQHIRDEAHRTAIGFHRKTRSKSHLKSALDDLVGVGAARKQALLVHFGSVKALRASGPALIAEVPGFGPALAQRVWDALQKGVAEE
ncbi:MAG: excinuclease ABC subunit UvrC, partial [Pseudomonadota bacterium]|nr:excinuclease ABC subunit UvrC [Pseudomonadota bacterium]